MKQLELYLKFNFINDGREFGRTYYLSPFLLKTQTHYRPVYIRESPLSSHKTERRERSLQLDDMQ